MIKDGSKTGQGRRGYLEEGAWDAIHVIEVKYHSIYKTKHDKCRCIIVTINRLGN